MGKLSKPEWCQECELFECYGSEIPPVSPSQPPYNNTGGNGGYNNGGGNTGGGNNGGGGSSYGCSNGASGFSGAVSVPGITVGM